MATSFRQDLRAGCFAVLTTYKAANPTLLQNISHTPPGAYNTPMAYVEKTVSETLVHTSGLRFRTCRVQVVIVNKLMDNEQATQEQDVLVDGLLDAFTAAPHSASGQTLLEPIAVTDTELTSSDGVRYAAAVITIEGSISEGRA